MFCATALNRRPPEQAKCHARSQQRAGKMGTALPDVGSRGAHRGVEILPVPQLEDEQLPQAQGVIALAAKVLPQQPADERRVEVAALARARGVENVRKQVRESAAEPGAERN